MSWRCPQLSHPVPILFSHVLQRILLIGLLSVKIKYGGAAKIERISFSVSMLFTEENSYVYSSLLIALWAYKTSKSYKGIWMAFTIQYNAITGFFYSFVFLLSTFILTTLLLFFVPPYFPNADQSQCCFMLRFK